MYSRLGFVDDAERTATLHALLVNNPGIRFATPQAWYGNRPIYFTDRQYDDERINALAWLMDPEGFSGRQSDFAGWALTPTQVTDASTRWSDPTQLAPIGTYWRAPDPTPAPVLLYPRFQNAAGEITDTAGWLAAIHNASSAEFATFKAANPSLSFIDGEWRQPGYDPAIYTNAPGTGTGAPPGTPGSGIPEPLTPGTTTTDPTTGNVVTVGKDGTVTTTPAKSNSALIPFLLAAGAVYVLTRSQHVRR